MLIANKIFHVTVLLLTYICDQFVALEIHHSSVHKTAVHNTADLKQRLIELRLGQAFHGLSSTKPLTSAGYDYEPAPKQRDITLSTRCNHLALFRATHISSKKITMPSYV